MQRRVGVGVGVVGGLLVALLVLGTIDTFVWLPQDLAPGLPLSRIYEAVGGGDDLAFSVVPAVLWLVIWSIATALYLLLLLPAVRVLAPVAEAVRPMVAIGVGGVLLGLAAFFHWWSAFAMGMSVSDTTAPGVGGTSPVGAAIVLIGAVAGGAGLVLVVAGLVSRRRPAPGSRDPLIREPLAVALTCGERATPSSPDP